MPTVRDGIFSSEVLWIGDILSGGNYVETGWRRDSSGNNRKYWGYYDSQQNWHFYDLGASSGGHDFQIEHKTSDNKWHVSIDGGEVGSVTLSETMGMFMAGGEVTDCGTSYNAMGVSGILNISYKRNHASSYSSWNFGWIDRIVDETEGYRFTELSSNSFQNHGNNP